MSGAWQCHGLAAGPLCSKRASSTGRTRGTGPRDGSRHEDAGADAARSCCGQRRRAHVAFAVRWLNPVWTRIEERYVHERIVMEPGAETAALRRLRRRLEGNGVVSITVGDEAMQTVDVPFMNGSLRVATGPINLAAASGAPLLPVFAVRAEDGGFIVEIQSPLDIATDVARRDRMEGAASEYALRLEPLVRRYPGQWIA
jgi:lauroyl/myristoyl acyltransferase